MSSPAPAVSIIMGTYNRAAIIPRAIDSVLAQDFKDWELIVVGHCTPDNTAEVVARYGDPRIAFHNMPDRKPDTGSATKNYGIQNFARSDVIAYLDDDDQWKPLFLSTMAGHMLANPQTMLAYCRSMYRDKKSGRRVYGNPFQRWMHGYSKEKLQRYNFLNVNCVVHRKRLLDEVGYWNPDKFFNDYDLWLRVAAKYDFDYVNQVLVETYVDEPPFLIRAVRKGWWLFTHGRSTPRT
ncbi:MAG TPA: glycosyltransferase [Kiritimatiellia bacterium]